MPKISIQLKESSQPIEHEFTNTYQKGTLYCVYCKQDEKTYKYPIADIWRIAEDYGKHQTEIAEQWALHLPMGLKATADSVSLSRLLGGNALKDICESFNDLKHDECRMIIDYKLIAIDNGSNLDLKSKELTQDEARKVTELALSA